MEKLNNEVIYLVTITETLSRTVAVKADSMDKAKDIVEKEYDDGHIILDADDFNELEITARKHTDEDLSLYEEI